MLRLLLLAYNVAVFAWLIYRMLIIYQTPGEKGRKALILSIGFLLILLPIAMVMRFIPATPVYLIVYPVALSCFLYVTRK